MKADNVKHIGRTKLIEDTLWFCLSGTGVEFYFKGKTCTFVLRSDSTYDDEVRQARFAVYVNDELIVDDVMDCKEKTVSVLDKLDETKCVIRLIKLSESADSTMGIRDILCEDTAILSPTEKKPRAIEFIGDSITCGYGVDGTLEDTYSTHNENVTKAYAYLTARTLDADYSMVSYSGHGIISGYTETGEKDSNHLVPAYYCKLGNSEKTFANGIFPKYIEWDFSSFVPDMVVINLGTNDASYTRGEEDKCQEYVTEYCKFLNTVRKKNPHAKILCLLGLMGQDLCSYMEQAVECFQKENGDREIYTMRLDVQAPENGVVVNYHPTYASHRLAADAVVKFIRERSML